MGSQYLLEVNCQRDGVIVRIPTCDLHIVCARLSVEVCEVQLDSLSLWNCNGLGEHMSLGVKFWEVWRSQNSGPWSISISNNSCILPWTSNNRVLLRETFADRCFLNLGISKVGLPFLTPATKDEIRVPYLSITIQGVSKNGVFQNWAFADRTPPLLQTHIWIPKSFLWENMAPQQQILVKIFGSSSEPLRRPF